MILLDASGLIAALDGRDPHQAAAARALRAAQPPFLLSPFVLAEVDYLVGRRISGEAARSLLDEVAGGAYQLEPFSPDDVREAIDVLDRFGDQSVGLADASIVVLANRYRVLDVLTLDERHFRVLRGPGDRPFRLLPADG